MTARGEGTAGMRSWGNSRELTKVSYGLVQANPGMTRWTTRAVVHAGIVGGIGVLLGLGVAFAGLAVMDSNKGDDASPASLALLAAGGVIVVLGLIAGLTAANLQFAGLISATDDVLHGRPVDEQAAKAAAHARIRPLFAWSTISIVVGALVSLIRGDGDSGILVTIVRALVAGLVAAVWAVVTALVLPVIVLERVGATKAIRRSASIIRSTWGEAVFGSVRIGARFGLRYTLPGVLLLIGGIVLAAVVGEAAIVPGLAVAFVGLVLMIIGTVKAATCRSVFGVALYRWATGEGALGPFSDDDLRGAVETRTGRVPTPV